MTEYRAHHVGFRRPLVLGGLGGVAVAIAVAGCGMDATDDEPAGAMSSLEDTGTVEEELALQQADELECRGEPADDKAAAAVIATVCGVANSVQGIPESDATEFEIGQVDGPLESGEKVSLLNTVNNGYIKYGKRNLGINLVWSSAEPAGNIEVHSPDGGPILYGEKVAIRVNDGGFLKYGHRKIGINLNWVSSNAPEKPFEWEVRGGTSGAPVAKNTKVRLFNTVENDYLVYCRRPTGINLGWAKDCAAVPSLGRVRTGYCPGT